MRPLVRINAVMDDGAKVGGAEIDAMGDVTMVLHRDEMGAISVLSADIAPSEKYQDALKNAFDSLSAVHEQLVKTEIMLRTAFVDMHWLSRFISPERPLPSSTDKRPQ